MHTGDPHQAAERNRAEAVFDPVALHLRDRGREADVEAARPDADEQRDGEVAELVQEHEQHQADDDDEPGHATGSASPRA
jgi:hypothetical protein